MPPHSPPRHGGIFEGQRTGGYDARYTSHSEAPGLPNAHREQRWERPPMPPSTRHKAHPRRVDDRPRGGQVNGGDTPHIRVNRVENCSQGDANFGSEPISRDDMFGSMAPCWRLLERGQAYMDQVCRFSEQWVYVVLLLNLTYICVLYSTNASNSLFVVLY